MNTAVAQHLNVAAEAILEVQEWARVLWVRVKGIGARFVSKKVVEMNVEMIPIEAPREEDYGSFRDFENALVEWRTPVVVEEVENQYQILWHKDGVVSATVWCWSTHSKGYWAVANTCHRVSGMTSVDEARDRVIQCHVNHIYRPAENIIDSRQPLTQDHAFAAIAGMHRTQSGEWIDDEEYMRLQEMGIDA